MMKCKILFVDDDPFVLQALGRTLIFACPEWQTEFVSSAQDAIQKLSYELFDVIVSDMRMPDMSGIELLEYVKKKHPSMIRLILSGQTEKESALKAFGPAHQFLSKPCHVDELRSAVHVAKNLQQRLNSHSALKKINSVSSLSSIPDRLAKINEQLSSSTSSAADVGEVIAQDIGMTAKIISLVNSPLFAAHRQIVDVREAVSHLGFDAIRSIVFSLGLFSEFDCQRFGNSFLDDLTLHSLEVGTRAVSLAKFAGSDPQTQNNALFGGLMHDLGKLILTDLFADEFLEAIQLSKNTKQPLWKMEKELALPTHSDCGAYLLSLWGAPSPVIEAICFHHEPTTVENSHFTPLIAVYLANELAKSDSTNEHKLKQLQAYLDSLEIDLQLKDWIHTEAESITS